jgi:hypothetical protein
VNRRLRVDVPYRDNLVIFENKLGWRVVRDDAAKRTTLFGVIIHAHLLVIIN